MARLFVWLRPRATYLKNYFMRIKSFRGVILSALCDAHLAFLRCRVGFAGRMYDCKILK